MGLTPFSKFMTTKTEEPIVVETPKGSCGQCKWFETNQKTYPNGVCSYYPQTAPRMANQICSKYEYSKESTGWTEEARVKSASKT